MTAVSRLRAGRATVSASKRSSGWPASTRSPSATAGEALTSQGDGVEADVDQHLDALVGGDHQRMVGAVQLRHRAGDGASTSLEVGSIATPSPTMFGANTESGTESSGTMTPESGGRMSNRG